jgi:hypothetical protein
VKNAAARTGFTPRRKSKSQAPNPRENPNPKRNEPSFREFTTSSLVLEFEICLGFGFWDFGREPVLM